MDPVTTTAAVGALDRLSAQHGFNAVLIIVLIAAIAVIVRAFLAFLKDERTEAREERAVSRTEAREERAAANEAFVGAIKEVTGELKDLRRDVAGGGRVYARPE